MVTYTLKTCRQCHAQFHAKREDALTCTSTCRVKYNRTHKDKSHNLVQRNQTRTDGLVTLTQTMLTGIFAGTHDRYGNLIDPILPPFPGEL